MTLLFLDYPEYKKNVNYYHEFWLMYLQNELIIAKMKDYVNEIKMIQGKINQFEVLFSFFIFIKRLKKGNLHESRKKWAKQFISK